MRRRLVGFVAGRHADEDVGNWLMGASICFYIFYISHLYSIWTIPICFTLSDLLVFKRIDDYSSPHLGSAELILLPVSYCCSHTVNAVSAVHLLNTPALAVFLLTFGYLPTQELLRFWWGMLRESSSFCDLINSVHQEDLQWRRCCQMRLLRTNCFVL